MKKFNLFKKVIVLVLTTCLMFTVAACNSKSEQENQTDEIQAFIEAENGYNASVYQAVEKYGSVCIEVEQDFADGENNSANVYLDEDCAFYYRGENDIDFLYEGRTYQKYQTTDGEIVYVLCKDYQDDFEVSKEAFFDIGFYFNSDEDYDISLVKNEDGTYTWTSSYPVENFSETSYATATVKLNENYEITSIETIYYYEDGTVYCTENAKYNIGVENTAVEEEFLNKLNLGVGETRHINYYEVTDGISEKVWEMDLPVGIGLLLSFPADYYNEDGVLNIYTDANLTTPIEKADLYNDADYYILVETKK